MPKVTNKKFRTFCLPTSTQSTNRQVVEQRAITPIVNTEETREELINRIEGIVLAIIKTICSGKLPMFSYSIPSLKKVKDELCQENSDEHEKVDKEDSCSDSDDIILSESLNYDSDKAMTSMTKVDFSSKRSRNKFVLMTIVMAASHRLAISEDTITRRSFYYELKEGPASNLCIKQSAIDASINHVANLLECAPWELRLVPSAKGLVAGDLALTLKDSTIIDCTVSDGALIPQAIFNLTSIRSTASCALIVEKDTVFQKLLQEDCPRRLNCILITGKGYPDVATRMLVKMISDNLKIPLYILTDADPFGIDIMCTYRYGSTNFSKVDKDLICKDLRWLGVHPKELAFLGVKKTPLTKLDLSKLDSLMNRPYATPSLTRQIAEMRNGKAEIEAISNFSSSFLTATYLPSKIKGEAYV
ncbi:meiotic recombination protein SPO11 [Prorops nasuta]|uniref:meiotic recombination protein SPO11 n=1 Tax=Prorops nasuta TaxID=863751 RepID=UPI0034CD2419